MKKQGRDVNLLRQMTPVSHIKFVVGVFRGTEQLLPLSVNGRYHTIRHYQPPHLNLISRVRKPQKR
jgi:hypothetical protein